MEKSKKIRKILFEVIMVIIAILFVAPALIVLTNYYVAFNGIYDSSISKYYASICKDL